MTKTRKYRSFDDILKEKLKSPSFVLGYLNESLKDNDQGGFLLALRQVVESRGNITEFAEKVGLPRQSIYRMLSPEGNPTMEKVFAILKALGLRMQLVMASESK